MANDIARAAVSASGTTLLQMIVCLEKTIQ